MPTYGRILHSLVAVGLFATVLAWTGSAGNERAAAASLPPPIVTKAIPLGTEPKHAALHSMSAAAPTKTTKPRDNNGTAQQQQIRRPDKKRPNNCPTKPLRMPAITPQPRGPDP